MSRNNYVVNESPNKQPNMTALEAFLNRHWEKSHAFIPNASQQLSLPEIDQRALFDAVVRCTNEYGRGRDQIVRLYIDNIEINVLRDKQQALLPNKADRSFEGYHDRIVEVTGTTDYSLIVTDWHQFDRDIWEQILTSVADVSQHVGISASRIDTQLFLGTYRRTPFGVHVDATSAFHFPVIGTKQMRFWSDDYVRHHPVIKHACNYDEHIADSIQVNAEPGDVIYWPSDYWHVGEGNGELSVTWRFAYWLADGFRQYASNAAAQVLQEMGERTTRFSTGSHGGHVDTSLVDTIINDLATLPDRASYRDGLVRAMAEQISAFGFLRLPEPVAQPLRIGSTIYRKSPFTFFLAELTNGRVCVAVAGYSLVIPDDAAIAPLLDALNRHTETTWLSLMRVCQSSEHVLTQILQLGLSSGALQHTR